jgi:hypothetical protein
MKRWLWRIWIALTCVWVGLLLLTGKYWCPVTFLFWAASQCTVRSYFEQLTGWFGVPGMTLIVGLVVGWLVAALRRKKP